MSLFFAPGIALMQRIRFPAKFAASGLLGFALLLYFGINEAWLAHQRLRGLEAEQVAVSLMKSLVDWNKVLIDSRHVVITAKEGDESVRSRFDAQSKVVDRKLEEIEAQTQAARQQVDMTKQVAGMRQGWQEVKRTVQQLPLDASFSQKGFAAHAPEYGRLYAVMRELGDSSGLSLEKDFTMFYLGFPLVNSTPSTAGIAVRIAAYSVLNVGRGSLTPADKVFYEITEARLADTFGNVEAMLGQSMQSNAVVKDTIGPSFAELKSQSKMYLAYIRQNFTSAETIAQSTEQAINAAKPTIDAAWNLVENNRVVLADLLEHERDDALWTRNLLIAATAIAIFATIYLYMAMYFAIRNSLGLARDAARAIARGELGRVPKPISRDELAELVEDIAVADKMLSDTVGSVRAGAHGVASASDQIASGNSDLSARTENQASALEETAASMEQLGSTVSQNADNAKAANQLAIQASTIASQGGDVVGQVVGSMREIQGSSNRIAEIIGVIDGIAFQTNILALNAAVEAARAGEQGRGFAVVASEVRSLAQRSATAAKEIKNLISESVDRAEHGSVLADQAGATMAEVVSAVRRVTDIMGEISSASIEQSAGVQQVGEAVTQMDQATQQNAALVEEMAAASSSLRTQAADLVRAVAVFQIGTEPSANLPNASSAQGRCMKDDVAFAGAPRATPILTSVPNRSVRSVHAVLRRTMPANSAHVATGQQPGKWEKF
ncbi:methyl-accepting chemotaxis protein [Hydrogenophaga palleronii]|uniref:methyl-accepting chemotaxis protein n=1 Tax=Hydrogenophaga palleronii TaxID=65655 RepID=UPI0008262129|nr:methyl-accepting chemotaxis protein [Hydrogenophaga palleronii]